MRVTSTARPSLPASEARWNPVRRVLWAVLALNLAVALAKLAVGWLTASISMVADGFHSLTDSASNVIALVGIAVAARPPDEGHPYGHWKFETLSALFIGGLLAMTAWEVLRSSIVRLWTGSVVEVIPASFWVMGTTLLVNLAVSTYERRRGSVLASEVLTADAAHTRADVYVSLAVIASLLAAEGGYPQLDLIAALGITAVIARAAFQILKQSAGRLADPAVVPARRVREVALSVPGVQGVHKVRTRQQPQGGHADLHLQLAPDMPLDRAHLIGHLVADRLRQELGLHDVVAHVEPPVGHRTAWQPEATATAAEERGEDPPEGG